jgi:hypothetical protein
MPKTIKDLTQDEIEKYWEALKKREDREKEFLREVQRCMEYSYKGF